MIDSWGIKFSISKVEVIVFLLFNFLDRYKSWNSTNLLWLLLIILNWLIKANLFLLLKSFLIVHNYFIVGKPFQFIRVKPLGTCISVKCEVEILVWKYNRWFLVFFIALNLWMSFISLLTKSMRCHMWYYDIWSWDCIRYHK